MRCYSTSKLSACTVPNDRFWNQSMSLSGQHPPAGAFAGCGLSGQHESVSCAHQLAPDVTSAALNIKVPALVRGNPSAVWRVPS
jgi:hypothetical protein